MLSSPWALRRPAQEVHRRTCESSPIVASCKPIENMTSTPTAFLSLGAIAFPVLSLITMDAGTAVAAGARSIPDRPPAAVSDSQIDTPARRQPFTVAVLGDGFGEALFEGLQDSLGTDASFAFRSETHAPFGLNDSRFDWPGALRQVLADRRIGAVVLMLGASDFEPIGDGATAADPGSPRWTALYGDRVAAIVAPAHAAGLPVTWVGLPIVADDDMASGYAVLNEIARDRATRAGARYVDSWDAFVDEGGRFTADGPDRNGRTARLRTADGTDFTHDGALKLASFVEPDLRHERDAALAALAVRTDVVVPREPEFDNDVNAQIRRELGLSANEPANRDTRGPVIVVTAPPTAPDGQLVAADRRPAPLPNAGGMSLAQRVVVEGRPLAPRPGRIDDFAWPRR